MNLKLSVLSLFIVASFIAAVIKKDDIESALEEFINVMFYERSIIFLKLWLKATRMEPDVV